MAERRRGDRTNRTVLSGLAALAVAGSVAGLLAGAGFFTRRVQHQAVFDNLVGRFMGRHGQWAWPVASVVALLLGLLALRWLLTQLGSEKARTLDLPAERKSGRTLLDGTAVLEPFLAEIVAYAGVSDAAAHWTGQPRDPDLTLVVTHRPQADLPGLVKRLESDAVAHLRTALDRPDLPVTLDLRATTKRHGR